jgi:hypothetical protein
MFATFIHKVNTNETNEQIRKMCYIYKTDYCPVMKNEIMSFAGKWMKPQIIMLSKISKT